MKTILISSLVSLAIGFTFGWLIRSASSGLESHVVEKRVPAPRPAAAVSPSDPIPDRPEANTGSDPERPTGSPAPGGAQVPESVKKEDRAKWLRLLEVLGLDDGQAKALEAAIAESFPSSDTGQNTDLAYAEAGAQLEKGILAILNPEQREAFAELQRRSLTNRIEIKAQEAYSIELGGLDLTTEQRDQAMELLRKRAAEEAAAIPASTRLLLTGSFLPLGNESFSPEAIALLQRLSAPPDGVGSDLNHLHRVELEGKVSAFEGILTPGQLALYRAKLAAAGENLGKIAPHN